MIQRKKPLMAMLGGGGQIPQYSGSQGGPGLKELMADIKTANKGENSSISSLDTSLPTKFDPYAYTSMGESGVGTDIPYVSGSRSGEKSSKPFLNRLLGGF